MNKRAATGYLLIAVTLTGCANMNETQRGAATGTGLGAAAGVAVTQTADNQLKLDIPSDV